MVGRVLEAGRTIERQHRASSALCLALIAPALPSGRRGGPASLTESRAPREAARTHNGAVVVFWVGCERRAAALSAAERARAGGQRAARETGVACGLGSPGRGERKQS